MRPFCILNWDTRFVRAILLALSIFAHQAMSQTDTEKSNPFDNIDNMTIQLLNIIESHKQDYPANEQAYFSALNNLMSGYVDFDYVSRKVMGNYFKSATNDQRQRFQVAFRQGLIETYGRGLMSYGDQKIVLINRALLPEAKRVLVVKQEIRSESAIYPLDYLMAKKKSTGQWNIINVVLSGIDLSKTFASQFLNSARKKQGDIDSVINNWLSSAK